MNIRELDKRFEALCSGDPISSHALGPLLPSEVEVLRSLFEQNSWDYRLSLTGRESLLNETQFRSLDQGRGPGMREALGDDVDTLLRLCRDLALGTKHRIKSNQTGEPIEGTEGRGLQQSAADIVSIVVVGTDSGKFLLNLNRRVLRFWVRKAKAGSISAIEYGIIRQKFSGIEVPSSKVASVEPDQLWNVWMFLTGRLQ